MRPYAARYPISDGLLVDLLFAGLTAYATGLTVQRRLPSGTTGDPMTRRMVTIRNDSGPEQEYQSRRRYGVNVWADSSVDAENMCLDAMAWLSRSANGQPITLVDELVGPYEVDDETPVVVADKSLYHFYFTARISVRGVNA